MEEISHHDQRQNQAGNQERNAKDETNCGALAERQRDDKTGNEKDQTHCDTE
jgi:hypothetical protein